jgi:hypothetical protein
MKVIAQRVWQEPAVGIGLLTSLVLLVVNLLGTSSWDAATVLSVLGPFASAIGIRSVVSPAAGPRPLPEDEAPAPPPSTPPT